MKFKYNKRILLFSVVLVTSLSVCFATTGMYIHYKSSMEYAQMEQIVLVNANKVNNVITKLLYKTQVLAALAVQSDGNVDKFERVAATILDDPAIKNVLVAPDGIVSNVYPLEGNEEVIGLNFFEKGNGNIEAIQARDSGQLVLGGPFDLVQGGQALVGRLTVYTKDASGQKNFWGLVSVTLNYPQALDGAGLDQLQNQGFAFEIWRTSPDTKERQIIACSQYNYDQNARFIEKPINILNANWNFRLSPVKTWQSYPETWVLCIGSLLISFLVAFFTLNTYNLKLIKNELEILTSVDPLTGALNRRGVISALEDLLSQKDCKLTLCYMDLNRFKSVNDKYGHGVGDKVLQQFAETFIKHTNSNQLFARMGGDEFVLIFKDIADEKEIDDFFDMARKDLKNISIGDETRDESITFSFGKAFYPSEAQNIDDLLHCADSDMYKDKRIEEEKWV